MARGVMGRVNDEALIEKLSGLDAQQRVEARAQHGKAASVSWRSAGSHKDESNIWRGGVAVCSYGEAALRELGHQRRERLGALLWACMSEQRWEEVGCGCGVRP